MARRSARKAAGIRPPRQHGPASPAPPQRRPRRLVLSIAVALALGGGVGGGLFLTFGTRPRHPAAVANGKTIRWSSVPHVQTDAPPWPSQSALLPVRLQPSGLHSPTMEATALDIHRHRDLDVDGRRVAIPALVGIDQRAGFLTELHT